MNRTARLSLPTLGLIVLVSGLAAQSPEGPARPGSGGTPESRETLRRAERGLGEAVERTGFASGFLGAAGGDLVLLVEGAPILAGRDRLAGWLRSQTDLHGARVTWMPYRVLVSADGELGITFGTSLLEPGTGRAASGSYISVWRKAAGGWVLAASVQNGGWAGPVTISSGLTRASGPGELLDPAAAADRAFARLAGDSGAPIGFARFIAPDGITFAAGSELNIGPADVFARMREGRGAGAAWQWHPVFSYLAESGDLGATIGEAEIRVPGMPAPLLSKYLTVWQRQPDGSLKFIVDAGNGRPSP